jgi:hypothetical protein
MKATMKLAGNIPGAKKIPGVPSGASKQKGAGLNSGMQAQQFSAAQLIQMEMTEELVDRKKEVVLLNKQAEESRGRIVELGQDILALEQQLQISDARARSFQVALSKLDPSYAKSRLLPLEPVRPITRYRPS